MPERNPPAECANCGATVPKNARACPECGADEQTGWRETSLYDGIDLPPEAWREDDDRAMKSRRVPLRVNGIAWYWWCIAAVLAALLVIMFLRP